MGTSTSATVLIGTFPESRQAERFIEELKQAGFRDDQIGVMAPGSETEETPAEEGATAGILAGGAWGVLFGAAIATGLIPGIGPVIAGGLLASIVGGAAFGAAAGGLLGALIGLGLTEEEAQHYHSELLAGRTLVVVKGNGRLAEAAAILQRLRNSEATDSKEPADRPPQVEELDQLL